MTEIVNDSSPEECGFQTTASGWGTSFAGSRRNPGARLEGHRGVEPLDVGSVEDPDTSLRDSNQFFCDLS